MTPMTLTFVVLLVTVAVFIWGKIRADIVALCSLLSLTLFNILTPTEALAGFSNSVVIMMIGLFIVGGAIFQTGLAKTISTSLLKLAGSSHYKLFLLVMLVTIVMSSIVSNTGTVALLLPIVVSMAAEAEVSARRLLIPMAFASSMGGLMTLIGTPPNLIVNDTLIGAGYDPLSFFSFLPLGIIASVIGILILWPLSTLLEKAKKGGVRERGNNKSPKELVKEYQLSENLFRIRITETSELRDKKLISLSISKDNNISIIEIRRKTSSQRSRFLKAIANEIAGPQSTLRVNDVVYVLGEFADVERFVRQYGLTFIDSSVAEVTKKPEFNGKFDFDEIGIAEVVVMSSSKLVRKSVKECGFRANYHTNILGVKRNKQYILKDVKDELIQAGDALLVQGHWADIEKISRQEADVVVVGTPQKEAEKAPLSHKAPIAGFLLIGMVLLMVFKILSPVIAVLLTAVLMILTRCFRNVESAYNTINWESIFLFAAMIPLATAMEKTGASTFVSSSIVGSLGAYGNYFVLAGLFIATSLLSMFISNTATAVLFAPIALQSALSIGISPYPFLFAVATAASLSFASPFSTPSNTLVMSAGRFNFMDYVKIGLPLQLIYFIVMIFIIPLLFPF